MRYSYILTEQEKIVLYNLHLNISASLHFFNAIINVLRILPFFYLTLEHLSIYLEQLVSLRETFTFQIDCVSFQKLERHIRGVKLTVTRSIHVSN